MGHWSKGVATVVGVLAAIVVPGTATATAKVVRAEGVLPPGQSGFVSLPGLVDGTGSPHLYDQNAMYIDFRRKPLLFQIDSAPALESPRAGVTIVRDAHGVPAVRGGSENDAWFGAGYAIAQDRLFQLEAFRHATKGRLAELTGPGSLDDDLVSRRDYYTASERQGFFDRLTPRLQARLIAYRDGINAWIDHVRLSPADLPGEYAATGKIPTPWTTDDSIAVGIFLARTVPSGDGNELANLRTIQQSGLPALQKVLPLRTTGRRPTTVPAGEGGFPQGRRRSVKEERAALKRSLAFADTLPKPSNTAASAPARKAGLTPGRIGRTGGSYMFAVRRKDGHAFLFNGPQLGFSTPELFVEVEVHWPGHDVRGVTAPGVPVIGIGHNGTVAWGFTSGLSDEDDLYAEKLVPGKPESYIFKGQERQMECRDETFLYSSGPAALLGGELPEVGSKTERICRTVHGPVQFRDGDIAYARRYAIWMRDIETIDGIVALNEARSIKDVDAAMNKVTWNENVIAIDSGGNIGYWHPGLFQLRPRGYDDRFPYPGTGEAEWPGLLDRTKTPRVINPKQGFLANWNNVPSQDWTNGDGESPERLSGAFHRSAFLMDLVRRLHRAPSFEAVEATIRRAGSTSQQRPLAVTRTRLRAAATGASGNAKAVLETLLAWDGDYVKVDAARTVHPGVATWLAFKKAAAEIALGRLGDGAKRWNSNPGRSHEYDISPGAAYALRTLKPADLRAAAATAHAHLAKDFGSADPARWRSPRKLYAVGAQGAGQAPELPFFDRGTWEQVIETAPDR